LLFLGLFTRLAAIIMAITMSGVTFMVGQGRFYMEDQPPFMFVLFAFIFFFDGGYKWSLDNLIFKKGVSNLQRSHLPCCRQQLLYCHCQAL
jgi:uncharacterized membrane protein YphA (DoxX/SURF4 family)